MRNANLHDPPMSTSLQASEGRLEAALKRPQDADAVRQYIAEVMEKAAAERDTVGPRHGLTNALAWTDDEAKWIGITAGANEALSPPLIGLLGELGGDASARLIGDRILGAKGNGARALTRAGIAALRNIGGVTAAVLLARLAGDDGLQDDLRQRAFAALEEIASFGSEHVAEGGLVSIDKDALAFWDQHRSEVPLWPPGKVIEELERIQDGEWAQRANAVRGVLLTRTRGELEAISRRKPSPLLFVSHGNLAASTEPSRWHETARCAVFISDFGELQINPHWLVGRIPGARDLACAVTSQRFRAWGAPMPVPRPLDPRRTFFQCRQLAAAEDSARSADEVFALGERNALQLLLELTAGPTDPSKPVLLTGTASARRALVTHAFAEQRAGRPMREFTCSRWPHALLDRLLNEVPHLGGATLFLDELDALTPISQARLLEVMKVRNQEVHSAPADVPFILVGTSLTPEELERGHLLEPQMLDWLSTGVTLYVSQAA